MVAGAGFNLQLLKLRVRFTCIARAVHVTKPALYRAFGDKPTLLLKAVERYAEMFGAPMMAAFLAEQDIRKAVLGFCVATVETATGEARSGCMMAAAVLGQSERVAEIRSYVAHGFSTSASMIEKRFTQEMRSGHLPRTWTDRLRAHALIDLMQGLLLRAKAGVPRDELLQDARSYVALILG